MNDLTELELEVLREIASVLGESDSESLAPLDKYELSEVLRVKPSTLDVWACTGRHNIPYYKIGRSRLYIRLGVIRHLIQKRMGAAA